MPQQAKVSPSSHINQPTGQMGNAAAQPTFGARNTHKPIKTIIGIALLLVLSFVLYQINGKSKVDHPAAVGTHDRAVPSR
jgi:hypothetical protein